MQWILRDMKPFLFHMEHFLFLPWRTVKSKQEKASKIYIELVFKHSKKIKRLATYQLKRNHSHPILKSTQPVGFVPARWKTLELLLFSTQIAAHSPELSVRTHILLCETSENSLNTGVETMFANNREY